MGAGVGSHVVNLLPVADGDDLVERRVALDEARGMFNSILRRPNS